MATFDPLLAVLMSGGSAPDVPTDGRLPITHPLEMHHSRKLFTVNGQELWQWRGVSAFNLLDRHVRGEDIRPYLACFPLANVVRVWPYVPWATGGWDAPPNDTIIAFVRLLASWGWRVVLTLLTDANARRIPWAISLIDALADARLVNLTLEAGNEPILNGIDVAALFTALNNSDYLWSSGRYEQAAQENNALRGLYGTAHTPRNANHARYGHQLMEYWSGAGPDAPNAGLRVPWVGDEPIRPDLVTDQIGYTKAQSFRALGGCYTLFGAGGTFHGNFAKEFRMPTADELACAAEFFAGLTAFPPDACLGAYPGTITQPGQHPECRQYPVGPWLARTWPPTLMMPGYIALDPSGCLARRA